MEVDMQQIMDMVITYVPRVIGAILVLIVGFWLVGIITDVVRRTLANRGVDKTILPFLNSVVSVGLKIMLLISVAGMFGIETTSFVAIFGALAFAIGIALQGSLGHFASGVMLLTIRPYKVGDLVDLGGNFGKVEGIQVFYTVLRNKDKRRIIIPNGSVTDNVIINYSSEDIICAKLTFGIGYDDDIDLAKDIILRIGKECPWILEDPKQEVVVSELADSSVNLITRPFCKTEDYWDTYYYMQEKVKKAFDDEGVNIPYPQMDLHLQTNNTNVMSN